MPKSTLYNLIAVSLASASLFTSSAYASTGSSQLSATVCEQPAGRLLCSIDRTWEFRDFTEICTETYSCVLDGKTIIKRTREFEAPRFFCIDGPKLKPKIPDRCYSFIGEKLPPVLPGLPGSDERLPPSIF